jgi:hypothetical protein
MGMLLFQNRADNSYSIVSISSFNQEASYSNDLLFGDLEYMKAMLFFNKYYDTLKLNTNKIENINVFNLQEGHYYHRPIKYELKKFIDLVNLRRFSKDFNKLSMRQNFQSDLEVARLLIKGALKSYSKPDLTTLENLLSPLMNESIGIEDLSTFKIKEMLKDDRFTYLRSRNQESLNFNDENEYIFAVLSSILLLKEGITPHGDAIHLKNYAIGFADFKSIFLPLFTDRKPEYDVNGKKIQGVIGGMMTTPPDRMPSVDMRNINSLINSGNSFVRQVYYKQSTILGDLTRKFFKDIHFSTLDQNWVNRYRQRFEPF